MVSLAASAARGSATTLVAQVVKLGLMLGSTIALARLLSPYDYGLVAMVVAIVGVGEIFRDFGLSMAALQAKNLTHQQQSNLFWLNAAVGGLLAVLFFFGSYLIAAFYGNQDLVLIGQALSVTFLFGGFSTQLKVSINRDLRFFALAVIDLVPYFLAFLAALALAVNYSTYWALVAQAVLVSVVTLVMTIMFARWRPGLPRRTDMNGLIGFGVSFAATQLVSYATRNVDSISIGRVWGPVELGFYDRAYSLLVLPLNQINTPLSRVAIPVLSRISDDRVRFLKYLRKAQLVALYVTASLFAVLAGMGAPLVALILGAQWSTAGQLLAILAIGGVFRSAVQIAYWIYMSLGLAKQQLHFYLVAQPLLILVLLAGLPWGATGVAIAHSIGFAAFWAASLLWAGRVAQLDVSGLFIDAGRIIGTVGVPSGLITFAIVHALAGEALFVQVLAGAGGATAWFLIAWLVIPMVRRDVRVLTDFIRLAVGKEEKK